MRGLVLCAAVVIVAGGAVWPPGQGDADTRPLPTVAFGGGTPVYMQTDGRMLVERCDGLAPVVGTVPAPLTGCVPVHPCAPCPAPSEVGQVYLLWPTVWRYRVTVAGDATCEPAVLIVTATAPPTATDTPTVRPTETMELTPTARPTWAAWVPLATRRR